MNINMQYDSTSSKLSYEDWDLGFVGSSVDDRGKEAIAFIGSKTKKVIKIEYDPINYLILIEEQSIGIDFIDDFLMSYLDLESKIILDCTSLGFVELLIISQVLSNYRIKDFDAIYLEPEYYRADRNKGISKRDFELSKSFEGYIGIPGHTLSISTDNCDKVVFFCGYESERIERAFEDLNLNEEKTQLIFGVPAFHSGWEMNSFSNNIRVIDERNLNRRLYFCGASNPLAIYEKLSVIYRGLSVDERLFIVPIGTKPMALGACLFKICTNDNQKLAILYDHPKRKEERSSKISRWNLYNISL